MPLIIYFVDLRTTRTLSFLPFSVFLPPPRVAADRSIILTSLLPFDRSLNHANEGISRAHGDPPRGDRADIYSRLEYLRKAARRRSEIYYKEARMVIKRSVLHVLRSLLGLKRTAQKYPDLIVRACHFRFRKRFSPSVSKRDSTAQIL